MIFPSVALPSLQEHDVQGEPDTDSLEISIVLLGLKQNI